jgi:hypothetical protein
MAATTNCQSQPATIILASDGIEDSKLANLNRSGGQLPMPGRPIFAGCDQLMIFGLAQGMRDPRETDRLRQEFADIERLVDVIVSTKIERFDLFGLALARRQYDDRQIRPFAGAPDDVLAISIRQTKVKQHDVRRFGGDAFDAFSDRNGTCHFVVIRFKRWLEKAQDRRLIIYDQHADLGAHPGGSSRGKVMTKRAPRPFWAGLSPRIVPA